MAVESTEEGHPLFLTDDADEHPLVSQIQVTRMENGQQVYAPRMRQASELQSLDQIAGEFGGGIYVLVARHAGRIVTSRKYVIPGKPKPMYDEAEAPGAVETKQTPAQVINPMQAMMGTGEGSIMSMVMMMMQGMMQQQAQAAQAQTQMFLAMMTNNQQQSSEEKAAARAELQANIERERIASERTMSLMREMMQSRGGGSGEEFSKGIEFMRSFAMAQIETAKQAAGSGGESELERLLGTGLELVQGYMAFKQQAPAVASAAEAVAGA